MIIKAIINPKSGMRIMRAVVVQARRLLQGEGWLSEANIRTTTPEGLPGGAEWIAEPFDLLFVAGGDGTLHLAVALLKGAGVDVPVAYLPTGTMNDMGHNLNLPRTAGGFFRMIKGGKTRRIDLGLVAGEYFHYVVAGGSMSRICYSTPQRSKNFFGRIGYYLEILLRLPQLLGGTRVSLKWDGGQDAKIAFVFMVSNASTLAGFPKMAPQAQLDDGLFDVLVFGQAPWYRMLGMLFRLISGTHTAHPDVSYFQTSSITIAPLSPKAPPLVVDGEKGPPMPARIEVVPRALSILVP